MQKDSFRNIEELFEFLPVEELKITQALRKITLDCIPNVTEYLSYNIPCYKANRSICFIWPGSVLWGDNKKPEGVRFGFLYGYLLNDRAGYLDKGNRKQVYWRDYTRLTETDVNVIRSFIFKAVEIDALPRIKPSVKQHRSKTKL